MKEAKVLFSNDVLLENGTVMKLDYSLIENYPENDQKSPFFGVKVTKYLNGKVETDEVEGVSTSREKVVEILKKLCDFEVTPISLVEILDDMISSEETEIDSELLTQAV